MALTALAGALVLWQAWPAMPPAATDALVRAAWGLSPGLALLAAYRLSGAYFIGPMARLERALLEPDRRLLWNSGLLPAWGAAPPLLREAVELAYLLVYAMVPAGALTLLLGGRIDALPRFWAAVFLSELACYAWLPWLRTRPPRVVEAEPAPSGIGPLRRLNLVVLRWGSIQVNTIPSAHAAGAVAVALAVHAAVPAAARRSSPSPPPSPAPPCSGVITIWWIPSPASSSASSRGGWGEEVGYGCGWAVGNACVAGRSRRGANRRPARPLARARARKAGCGRGACRKRERARRARARRGRPPSASEVARARRRRREVARARAAGARWRGRRADRHRPEADGRCSSRRCQGELRPSA